MLENTPHHVVIESRGNTIANLAIRVTTRVEFDGVAMVAVTLTPLGRAARAFVEAHWTWDAHFEEMQKALLRIGRR